MSKKILAIVLISILVLSSTFGVSAEAMLPASIESPKKLSLRTESESVFTLRWTNPEMVMEILDNIKNSEYNGDFSFLIDWKKNDGQWNIAIPISDPNWDGNLNGPFSGYLLNMMIDQGNACETFFTPWHLDPSLDSTSKFDLINNTYYFRIRYLLEPYANEFEPVYSPYSEVASIGKNAATNTISKLDSPQQLKVEVKKDSSGKPFFQLDWVIPESIIEANKLLPVSHIVDFKIGNGKWLSETTAWDGLPGAYSGLLTSTYDLDPVEKNLTDKVIIEENIYHFRIAFVCEPTDGKPVISPYSNIVSTKMPAYSDASPWAKPELEKADGLGLITDTLRGEDMTRPITREEFAESAVKFYEMVTGKKADPHPTKKFLDCDNIEVLKALNLNITAGVGDGTKFEPDSYLLRQQMAAMITRTLTACYEELILDISGQPDFLDQKEFAAYAINPAKFMAKYKITVGDGKGNFIPNNNCSRQEAIAFLLRSYLNGDQYLK